MIPLYLKYLNVQEFGAWLAFSTVVGFMAISDLGLNNLIIQRTAKLYGSGKMRLLGYTVISLLTMVSILSGILLFTVWLLVPSIINLMNSWMTFAKVLILPFRLAVLDSALTLIVFGSGGVLLGLQRPAINMAAIIGGQLTGIIITILGLRSGMNLLAIPFGMVIGTLLALVINLSALARLVAKILPPDSIRFNITTLRESLSESSMLFAVRICNIFTTRSYGMVVASVLSTPLVVVLELTRKASLMVTDVVSRIPMSLLPALSHMAGAGEREKMGRIISLLFRMTLLISLLGAGGVILLNRDFVRLWTGSQYYGGNYLNCLFSIYAVAQLLNAVAFNVNFATGHLKIIAGASVSEAFLHIVLISILGFLLGLPGVAAGALLAVSVSLTIQGNRVLRFFDLNILDLRWIRGAVWIIFLGSMPVILGGFVLQIWTPSTWLGLALFGLSYIITGGTIYLLFDRAMRIAIWDIIPRISQYRPLPKLDDVG